MSAEDRVDILLGNPRKAVIAMAIPLILSLLVSQVNVLADRAWCAGLGDDAMSAIARQPEAAGDIRTNMILVAAFVEGVALFACVVCLLIAIAK